MKIRIIAFLSLTNMFFGCFSQENSKLSKALNNWIKYPDTELAKQLNKISGIEVKSVDEAKLICKSLEIINGKILSSFNENTENNLYSLTGLFQDASTKESATYLDKNGIGLLAQALKIIHSKKYETKSSGTEMMVLKMFAMYKSDIGLGELSELIKGDFKNDEYLWSIIMNSLSEDEGKYNLIIGKLSGKIPGKFLGITYLDMCNSIAAKQSEFKHPFNNQPGYKYLDSIIKNPVEDHESYVISVTTSIPFLEKSFQDSLLAAVSTSQSIDVQIEAAWAGAKLGKEIYLNNLINYARDYRYSKKAIEYLNELKLNSKIPPEVENPDFKALSEMCSWLAHPNEFGESPDKAEIYDKRELYWPPTKDRRVLYLIKYLYKKHADDGSDEVGIGLVGSVTFSLFSVEKMNTMKPVEIYAIHCNWEMEKENYEDVKSGLALLRKYNKQLE